MKILFLSNIPSPYRVEFFNELGKKVDLTVVFEAQINENLNKLWFSGSEKNFKSIFLKKGKIEEKKINFKIFKYLKKNHYDFVIVTNYAYLTEMLALVYIKFRKIPYLLEVDGGLIREESKIKHLFKKFLISNAHGYISPSESTDEFLIHYGADSKKIYRYNFTSLRNKDILNHPVEKDEKLAIRRKLNIREDKIILSVGQFIHRKGFDVLIDSAKNLSADYGIYIIGGSPIKEYIDLINKYNLNNIHFIGFLNKDELANYYLASDLFAFPTREDIWGLVINEAMAKGLPVITTDKCVAGLELIENNINGFIVPIEDADELCSKIKLITENIDLREKMQENTLETISQYTIENMANRHLEIFGEINGAIK